MTDHDRVIMHDQSNQQTPNVQIQGSDRITGMEWMHVCMPPSLSDWVASKMAALDDGGMMNFLGPILSVYPHQQYIASQNVRHETWYRQCPR